MDTYTHLDAEKDLHWETALPEWPFPEKPKYSVDFLDQLDVSPTMTLTYAAGSVHVHRGDGGYSVQWNDDYSDEKPADIPADDIEEYARIAYSRILAIYIPGTRDVARSRSREMRRAALG